MIQVKLLTDKGRDIGFEVYGHADSNIAGKDLICAAVSSIVTFIVNSLVYGEGLEDQIDYRLNSGDAFLRIRDEKEEPDQAIKLMLKAFRLNMEQLAKQYDKYIKIVYLEVSDD